MPTVIVEDGSIVAGANSFVTAAYVTTYAAARNRTEWDPNASATRLDAAVLEGGDYLKNEQRFLYRGSRLRYDQLMPYPRQGASEYRGPSIPNNVVPWRLKDAQAELAIRAYVSPGQLQVDLARGGMVQSEAVGPISTSYFPGASPETVITTVMGFLMPLLLQSPIFAIPQQSLPEDPVEFQAGTFDNNGPSLGDLTS